MSKRGTVKLQLFQMAGLHEFFRIMGSSYDQKLVVFRSVQMHLFHIAIRPDFATLTWHFREVMGTSLF